MKAIQFSEYGGPEVLSIVEIAKPEPVDGEVLVRVQAAGINPVDWKIRQGLARQLIDPPLPLIPGTELSGTVEKTGKDVPDIKPGDRVFGLIGLWGANAEYVCVPASLVAPIPSELDFTQASVVPLAGSTAWNAVVDDADVQAGQKVLVHGGGGGVGSMAVQVAKARGAEVVATGSARSKDKIEGYGARFVDYTAGPFEERCGTGFDVVIDTRGGEIGTRSMKLLKPGGMLVAVAIPPDAGAAEAAGIRAAFVLSGPQNARLAELSRLIDRGELQVESPVTYPFTEVSEAHRVNQSGESATRIAISF